MKETLTNKVIPSIVRQVTPDKIFLRQLPVCAGEGKYDMHILMPSQCHVGFRELEPLVDMAFGERDPVPYRLYNDTDVRRLVSEGDWLYLSVFNMENLGYTNDSASILAPPDDMLEICQQKAWKNFREGMSKAEAFLEGARFYWEKADFRTAAFSVHQAVELTYRILSLAIIGRDSRTHAIREQKKQVSYYAQPLNEIFPDDTDDEKELLSALERAYVKARYENGYSISENMMACLVKKAGSLHAEASRLFECYLSHSFNTRSKKSEAEGFIKIAEPVPVINNVQTEDDPVTSQEPLGGIISELVQVFQPEKVWCFGRRELFTNHYSCISKQPPQEHFYHYDILVVTANSQTNENDVLNFLLSRENQQVGITALVHSCNVVKEGVKNGNRFFSDIQKKGDLLYSAEPLSTIPTVEELDPAAVLRKACGYWEKRYCKASGVLKAAEVCLEEKQYETALALLNQCLVQLCAGMIYVFIGYRPEIYNLDRLLDLCDHFTENLSIIFPRNTEDEKRILNLLNKSFSEFRYRVAYRVDQEDASELFNRIDKSVKVAALLCNDKIAEFEGQVTSDA